MIEVYPVEKPKKDRIFKALFKPKKSKKQKEFDALFQRECDKLRRDINDRLKIK